MNRHYLVKPFPGPSASLCKLPNGWGASAVMVPSPLDPLRRVGSGLVGRLIRIARGSAGVAHSGDKA